MPSPVTLYGVIWRHRARSSWLELRSVQAIERMTSFKSVGGGFPWQWQGRRNALPKNLADFTPLAAVQRFERAAQGVLESGEGDVAQAALDLEQIRRLMETR